MFIIIPYRYLVAATVVFYVLHIILGIKPDSMMDYEWEKPQKVLVKQANRSLECLFVIALAWFFKNYYLFSYSLHSLTWVLRILAGFSVFRQITFLIPFLSGPINAADKRVIVSILISIFYYTLLLVSI